MHQAIARLTPGAALVIAGSEVRDAQGVLVGRLAKHFKAPGTVIAARVRAIAVREARQEDPAFAAGRQVERWEVVVPAITSALTSAE